MRPRGGWTKMARKTTRSILRLLRLQTLIYLVIIAIHNICVHLRWHSSLATFWSYPFQLPIPACATSRRTIQCIRLWGPSNRLPPNRSTVSPTGSIVRRTRVRILLIALNLLSEAFHAMHSFTGMRTNYVDVFGSESQRASGSSGAVVVPAASLLPNDNKLPAAPSFFVPAPPGEYWSNLC